MLTESGLERVEAFPRRQPFDRRHLRVLGLQREHRAALHRPPVEQNGAGPALARVAAGVRPGQPEAVAERVEQQRPRLQLEDVFARR